MVNANEFNPSEIKSDFDIPVADNEWDNLSEAKFAPEEKSEPGEKTEVVGWTDGDMELFYQEKNGKRAKLEGIQADHDKLFADTTKVVREILKGKPEANYFEDKFDAFNSKESKEAQKKAMDSFFNLVDAFYPDPTMDGQRDGIKRQLAHDFLDDAIKGGDNTVENIMGIAAAFRVDSSQRDMNIATRIDAIAKQSDDFNYDFSNKIVNLLGNYTDQERKDLEDSKEAHLKDNNLLMGDIADILSSSTTAASGKLFGEMTATFAPNVYKNTKGLYEGMLDYIDFKKHYADLGVPVENVEEFHIPEPVAEEEPSGPLSKPVIF